MRAYNYNPLVLALLLALSHHVILRIVPVVVADDEHCDPTQETEENNNCLLSSETNNDGFGSVTDTDSIQLSPDNDDDNDDKAQSQQQQKETQQENAEPSSLREFMSALSRMGTSWSNVLKKYRNIIKNSEGKNLKGDAYVTNAAEAMTTLRQMVETQQQNNNALDNTSSSDDDIWSFRAAPYKTFGKTLDDLYMAFIRWASIDGVDDDDCMVKGGVNKQDPEVINVSKAFRRLASYAEWIHSIDNNSDSTSSNVVNNYLSTESLKQAQGLIYTRVTHDACGRAVWWIDLAKTDFESIRKPQMNPYFYYSSG